MAGDAMHQAMSVPTSAYASTSAVAVVAHLRGIATAADMCRRRMGWSEHVATPTAP